MTPRSKYTQQISSIHDRVMLRVLKEKPTTSWQLTVKEYGMNVIFGTSIILSITLLTWFINNLIQNQALLRPSLIDVSGVEWVWSPELLLLSLAFYACAVAIKKNAIDTMFKYAGIGVLIGFGILANVLFATPTTQAFQSNIKPQYNSLGYRQFSRDYHIKVLLEHDTYYGAVTEQDFQTNTMKIDHGGVIKTFVMPANMPNLVNQPVEVEFNELNNTFSVNKYNVLR